LFFRINEVFNNKLFKMTTINKITGTYEKIQYCLAFIKKNILSIEIENVVVRLSVFSLYLGIVNEFIKDKKWILVKQKQLCTFAIEMPVSETAVSICL
jgi:hypothetical protein